MKKVIFNSFTIICIVTIITSCINNTDNIKNSSNGIWESIGCGYILQIKDSTEYNLYDINPVACLPNTAGPFSDLSISLNLSNGTLNLVEGMTAYRFHRVESMPISCVENDNLEKSANPLFNFDYFAKTVEQHYAFMELNNIQWEALYNEQRAKLDNNSADVELFLIIEETLEKLNDNHAFLEATNEVHDAVDLLIANDENDDVTTLPEYGDLYLAKEVTDHHLEINMTKDSWLIDWGMLTDKIGYIQVKTMWLYADIEIPQNLIDSIGYVDAYIKVRHELYEGAYIKKEVEGVRRIMDEVMTDLRSAEAIVVDVRFNGGGQDAVSCEILRNFSDEKTQIWTQHFRDGDMYTDPEKIFLGYSENAYTKPVYVLTSPKTGSAAECFSLATMSMDHIKRIGDNTDGAMSTTLDKTLPNGWVFSISNQVLMDNHGKVYENIGIPADFKIDYPDDIQSFFRSVLGNLDKDKQDILGAIEILGKEI